MGTLGLTGLWGQKAAADPLSSLHTTPSVRPESPGSASGGTWAWARSGKESGSAVLNGLQGEANCPAQAWGHTCQEITGCKEPEAVRAGPLGSPEAKVQTAALRQQLG